MPDKNRRDIPSDLEIRVSPKVIRAILFGFLVAFLVAFGLSYLDAFIGKRLTCGKKC